MGVLLLLALTTPPVGESRCRGYSSLGNLAAVSVVYVKRHVCTSCTHTHTHTHARAHTRGGMATGALLPVHGTVSGPDLMVAGLPRPFYFQGSGQGVPL